MTNKSQCIICSTHRSIDQTACPECGHDVDTNLTNPGVILGRIKAQIRRVTTTAQYRRVAGNRVAVG